ncbi:hypothetical protein ACSZM1_01480 [Aeromonas veronii]
MQLDQLQGEQHEEQQHADDAAGKGERQDGCHGFACQQAGDDDHKVTKVQQGALRDHVNLIDWEEKSQFTREAGSRH